MLRFSLALTLIAVLALSLGGGLGFSATPTGVGGVAASKPTTASAASENLPRVLQLASTNCAFSRQMAPILADMRGDLGDKLKIDTINVDVDRDAVKKFGVKAVPVQIFLDAAGKELFRHEGFYSRIEIVNKCNDLGMNLPATTKPAATSGPVAPPSGST